MDIVKKKYSEYSELLNVLESHMLDISSFALNKSDSLKNIRVWVRDAKTYLKKINEITVSTTDDAFALSHYLGITKEALQNMYTNLNMGDSIISDMSASYVSNTTRQYSAITSLFDLTQNSDNNDMPALMSFLMQYVIHTNLEGCYVLYLKYPNATNLYSTYLQHKYDSVDQSKHNSNDKYAAIEKYVDKVKDDIINSADVSKRKEERKDRIAMQRFKLLPVYSNLTIPKVTRKVLAISLTIPTRRTRGGNEEKKYDPSDLSELSTVLKEKRIGLLVMVRISTNQISYDMSALMDKKLSESFGLSKTSGINNNMIEKFDNIKNISKGILPSTNTMKIGDTTSNKWIVLRTLNGKHYDIMSSNKKVLFEHANTIDKIERGPSLRISNYQRICATKILRHIRTPVQIEPDDETHDIVVLSKEIHRDVMSFIDTQLELKPKTLLELSKCVSGDNIDNIVFARLVNNFKEKKNSSNPEFSSTFLSNLNGIIKNYSRKIREQFAQQKITNKIFSYYTEEKLYRILRDKLEVMAKVASEDVFDPKKDVFEKLVIKEKLLGIVL
jgi:hypothetical protein